jgi:23S rRNA (guanosine2251-2'-O)-methyltransferase
VSSSHERNDPKRPFKGSYNPGAKGGGQGSDKGGGKGGGARPHYARAGAAKAAPDKDGAEWLWGWHAVTAALENPRREPPKRLLVTEDRARMIAEKFGKVANIAITDSALIGRELPAGAVHQGIALKTPPPEAWEIEDMASPAHGFLIMLDQVTDPQNVGAILRSAAAFGARGLIVQDRHAPSFSGALAKAAAGAVDALPHARVTNLSRALERLSDLGWRSVGLDGAATESLADVITAQPTVLVLGSEGDGLRRLVSEHCDALGRIPMPGGFESLNVSAAAAVAMYEAGRPR